jgi:penicillin-binding protein 2
MQIANLCACIANRGYWITPHMVKSIEDIPLDDKYKVIHQSPIERKYYDVVVHGMALSILEGTSKIAQIPGVEVCGKTGTAQDPPRKDHSIFMGFAPKDHPKIAIMCIVENSGFGATYAAPICSLMMEYYLKRKISPAREELENSLTNTILISGYGTKN